MKNRIQEKLVEHKNSFVDFGNSLRICK